MPRRNKAAPAPFESFAIASAETENGRQKFPVEVLSLIFSYASDAALFNALMTCKLWAILAVPRLWHLVPRFNDRKKMMEFLFSNYDDGEWQARKGRNRTGEKRKPLHLKDRKDDEYLFPYLGFVKELHSDRLEKRSIDNKDLSKLIGRLANLEKAHFTRFGHNSDMLEALARAGSKLKHLHIETLLKTEKNGAQFLLSFPSLTSLHLLDGICVSHEVIEPCIKKQGPKLERLTLIGCWIGIETVLLIMEACPNLKFLDLSYQPPSIALMGTEAPVIGNGTLGVIADNGNNLEELILKYYPAGAMAEDALLRVIRSLPKLKLFDTTNNFFIGGEVLREGGRWGVDELEAFGGLAGKAAETAEA